MALKQLKPSFPPRPHGEEAPGYEGTNRRRAQRQPQVAEAWVYAPTATDVAERLRVSTVNLSRCGVAFELEGPLPTGAYYRIDIQLGEQHIRSEIHVVSCEAGEDGRWRVGAEFC